MKLFICNSSGCLFFLQNSKKILRQEIFHVFFVVFARLAIAQWDKSRLKSEVIIRKLVGISCVVNIQFFHSNSPDLNNRTQSRSRMNRERRWNSIFGINTRRKKSAKKVYVTSSSFSQMKTKPIHTTIFIWWLFNDKTLKHTSNQQTITQIIKKKFFYYQLLPCFGQGIQRRSQSWNSWYATSLHSVITEERNKKGFRYSPGIAGTSNIIPGDAAASGSVFMGPL